METAVRGNASAEWLSHHLRGQPELVAGINRRRRELGLVEIRYQPGKPRVRYVGRQERIDRTLRRLAAVLAAGRGRR